MSYEAFWHTVTRFGEAQILLPTALLLALWFAWRGQAPRLAATWLLGIGVAIAVTTVSKVAFMGYGIGWPALDFTGVSGHSMFAASVYPLAGVAFVTALAGTRSATWQPWGLALGFALAVLVGVSRVETGAHSWSEVVAGLAVGGTAATLALFAERMPVTRTALWLPLVLGLWLGGGTTHAPPSTTHGWVTRLALAVSGRSEPYTRGDMLAAWRSKQPPVR